MDLACPEGEGERILIIAPHPDDETLGMGATIAYLTKAGHTVAIVFITNGDANRAAKRLLTLSPFHRAVDYRALGYRRQKEASLALGSLGVGEGQIVFLGYPDGGLMKLWTDHWVRDTPFRSPYTKRSYPFYSNSYNPDAVYSGEDLMADLAGILSIFRPTILYVPHEADAHYDHQAANLFAMAALATLQLETCPDVRLYLIHSMGWPYPNESSPSMAQDVFADWFWNEQGFSDQMRKEKATAIRAYSSQRWTNWRFLNGFIHSNEVYATPLHDLLRGE
jgi:LmbE family N-acetylglucosaminyl deacetylase